MGKTYEALERAEKEYKAGSPEASSKPREEPRRPVSQPRRESCNGSADCYEALKTNLLARHPDKSIKTILFSGTTHGDGSSTTAINCAATLAQNCQLKVLLVEANLRTPSLHEVFHLEPEHGLSDVLTNGTRPASCIKKVGPENLYVVTRGGKQAGPVGLFESARFCDFLKTVRDQFDYVILDGPPVPSFSEARVICAKVDGVIMVVESGKTREQVAVRAKKELEEAGGKVLGVVLNKRKFHIPEWIYRRL
jgi:protein-tyrosine kinase